MMHSQLVDSGRSLRSILSDQNSNLDRLSLEVAKRDRDDPERQEFIRQLKEVRDEISATHAQLREVESKHNRRNRNGAR
jgi:septal ring factor EnvC (AmiA/AmiB activator)